MDEAAPQAASGTAASRRRRRRRDEPPQPPEVLLEALRWAWDGVYVIAKHSSGELEVARMDGHGVFRAADVLEARDAIRADYARLPVARPIEKGALGRRLAFEKAHPEVTWGIPTWYHKATWTDGAGNRHEEVAVTVDGMLKLLRKRGFEW
jgi:hypothetical protein